MHSMWRLFIVLLLFLACACTPLRQPLGEPSQAPALRADRAVMADGYRLPLEVWRPDGPPRVVLVALHGFNDYRSAFASAGAFLAERGVITYAFDQRGFGETAYRGLWPGHRVMAADARQLLALARARHPGLPLYLLGESMGGAVAMRALAAEPELELDGLVLVAPAVWSRLTMPWYQRLALEIAVRVAPGWRPSGESLQIMPSDNIEMLRALAQDPLVIKKTRIDTVYGLVNLMDAALLAAPALSVRGLLLYGERDELIPMLPTCRLLESLPPEAPWRFALYSEGYHMLLRDLQAERVLEDLAHWLLDESGPLPSGFELSRPGWREEHCAL